MTHPTPAAASGPRAVRYRGRFAPSPSGPLHFGSLVAALGSYLDARAARGEWLLRIEDVDQPRSVAGAADDIRRTLEAFAFEWDGEVVVQSRRLDLYHAALVRLQLAGDVYPCACSRREVADSATLASVDGGLVYPGTCRTGVPEGRAARAWRMRVPDGDAARLAWIDRVQGAQTQDLAREVGDFILLRADGQFAYQLAVVVDDALQGVTDVVRGADLLASTPRQIWLQQRLGVAVPRYAHLPVATNAAGEKLSKQTLAAALDVNAGSGALAAALRFLGHAVPAEMASAPLAEFWPWAIAQWSMARVPALRGKIPD
ncbi:MAG: tRNA glutamyl-Q(34) synthetase GluQRS [Candidatus Accumulibacter sp. 66-26]|nr:tRNA glutamyl-Q(34) synthetase GluQRS [Accumulibacter sp.]OJW49292.1 MAG: tRNA glutamyl-Q(34) synthetase GluQRS [Candidatus Accumulibacter sp. 66-26]